jgi:SNF2 family DNA or RNA helicase
MSSWTKMLDLIGLALIREGFQFERIDGGKSALQRKSAIEKFNTNLECDILLASIGSAGVG